MKYKYEVRYLAYDSNDPPVFLTGFDDREEAQRWARYHAPDYSASKVLEADEDDGFKGFIIVQRKGS